MFDPNSRYYNLETAVLQTADGRRSPTSGGASCRAASCMPLLAEVTVVEGDRLDLITSRTLGDPEQFWRVADANDAMDPRTSTRQAGEPAARPALPQAEGVTAMPGAEPEPEGSSPR